MYYATDTFDSALQHIASNNTVGIIVEMCLSGEKRCKQLHPKQVFKDHVHSLLLKSLLIVNYSSVMCTNRDMTTWNEFISSDMDDF